MLKRTPTPLFSTRAKFNSTVIGHNLVCTICIYGQRPAVS